MTSTDTRRFPRRGDWSTRSSCRIQDPSRPPASSRRPSPGRPGAGHPANDAGATRLPSPQLLGGPRCGSWRAREFPGDEGGGGDGEQGQARRQPRAGVRRRRSRGLHGRGRPAGAVALGQRSQGKAQVARRLEAMGRILFEAVRHHLRARRRARSTAGRERPPAGSPASCPPLSHLGRAARRPSISCSITPKLKMSLRWSASSPRTCSGDMYPTVPITTPACVRAAGAWSRPGIPRAAPDARQPEVENLRASVASSPGRCPASDRGARSPPRAPPRARWRSAPRCRASPEPNRARSGSPSTSSLTM